LYCLEVLLALVRSAEGLNIACGSDTMHDTLWTGLIDDVRIHNRAVQP